VNPPLSGEVLDDRSLAGEIITHLEVQIVSARGLLKVVLEQGAAIRSKDVNTVVRLAGILHGEMSRRQVLEQERHLLLGRCGERLGVASETVTLTLMSELMDREEARRAGALSAELKGLLHELRREHSCNRALMQIELGFLDHLMRMLAVDQAHAYDQRGSSSSSRPRSHGALRVLDLRA
jgi:hypothetical protein